MNIEQIKNRSVADTIRAMCDAAENPTTKLDADTFGEVKNGEKCGCFAFNLAERDFERILTNEEIETWDSRTSAVGVVRDWFIDYQLAINSLRWGDLANYNYWANLAGLQLIPDEFLDYELPWLKTDFTPAQLEEYRKFADVLDAPCGSR